MNQGKLEVVKQEMARVNRHFWNQLTKMDGNGRIYIYHHIYYCVQESLRRNGVVLIVNKRV